MFSLRTPSMPTTPQGWPAVPTSCWSGGSSRSRARPRSSPPPALLPHRPATGRPRHRSFLRGLLLILKDSGYSGLVLVLDEIETLQRVRGDVREKRLKALRQLINDSDGGRFPNLYLLTTGTPAFFDGPQGVQRLEPLAQRLHVDFQTDARFDNPRAVQLRLPPFDHARLVEVGVKVRDLFVTDCASPDRVQSRADNAYVEALGRSVAGKLGGKVGIAPRLFLKKLVADVLDRIDQFEDFNPTQHYQLTVNASEMTSVEREARAASVDDIEIDV
jgi:hypothetical protein